MKWIKLSDEKPKQGGVYLACNEEDIQICGYWWNGWGSIERDAPFKPTHWMPLPPPPTSEADERQVCSHGDGPQPDQAAIGDPTGSR